jgi:hypothetical protein
MFRLCKIVYLTTLLQCYVLLLYYSSHQPATAKEELPSVVGKIFVLFVYC